MMMTSSAGPLVYRAICRNGDRSICRRPGGAPDGTVVVWKKWMRSLAKKLVNEIYVLMTRVSSDTPSSVLFLSAVRAIYGTVD